MQSPETRTKGYVLVDNALEVHSDEKVRGSLVDRIKKIKEGERDLYF